MWWEDGGDGKGQVWYLCGNDRLVLYLIVW